jgi:hypothetical protein
MEGRLMLSATMAEIAPLELPGFYATVAVGQLNPGEKPIRVTMVNEGGFITNLSGSGVATPAGMFDDSDSVDFILSSRDAVTNEPLSMSGANEMFLTGAHTLTSGGLQAVVFSDDGGLAARNFAAWVFAPPEKPLALEEGGLIPIHELLAGLRHEVEVAASKQVVSSLTAEMPIDPQSPKHLEVSSSDNTISGEWGRAMVFEFAGGEPGVGERSALGERAAQSSGETTEQSEAPLSVIEAQGDGGKVTAGEQGAAQLTDQAADVRAQEQDAELLGMNAAAAFSQANSVGVIGSLTEGRLRHSASQPQLTRMEQESALARGEGDADRRALDTAAAFEQLGEEGTALVEFSTSNWWERSLGLTPLLVALALERVAAHHARQPNRETPAAIARRQLRPQDMAGRRRKQQRG